MSIFGGHWRPTSWRLYTQNRCWSRCQRGLSDDGAWSSHRDSATAARHTDIRRASRCPLRLVGGHRPAGGDLEFYRTEIIRSADVARRIWWRNLARVDACAEAWPGRWRAGGGLQIRGEVVDPGRKVGRTCGRTMGMHQGVTISMHRATMHGQAACLPPRVSH